MFGKLDFGFPIDMRFAAQESPPADAEPPVEPTPPPAEPPVETPPVVEEPVEEPQFATEAEEMVAIKKQLEESQAQLGRQSGEIKLLRDYARVAGTPPPTDDMPPAPESILAGIDTSKIYEDSEGVLNTIAERILEVGENRMTALMESNTRAKAASEELRTEFYGKNPHLVGFEEIVFAMSSKVHKANPGVRDPRLLLGVIAEECDGYIERLAAVKKKADPSPPPKPKSKRSRITREPPEEDKRRGDPNPGNSGLDSALDYADSQSA